jgi:hypothetical protein
MNKNTKRNKLANPTTFQPRKSTHAKVGFSAVAIVRKLYPPYGERPETEAYKSDCLARGLVA